jgi:hypothetical protein
VLRALLRNEAHRLCLAVSIGLGWLLALQSGSVWEGPLIATYLLTLGLRLSFELPAGVPANWIFRATLDVREQAAGAVARRVLLAFLTPAVLVPCLLSTAAVEGVARAVFHTLYVLMLALCLMEPLLAGYRKIPLTSPLPGFRDNLLLSCLLQLLGFEAFTHLGAWLEQWMAAAPLRYLLLPAAMLAAWKWNQGRLADAREAGELETSLSFDSQPPPAIERLKLSDTD